MPTFTVADGSKVFFDGGASWVEIRGVRNIQIDSGSKTKIDNTELRAAAKSFVGGKPEFGAITMEWMFDKSDTNHTAIRTRCNTQGTSDRIYIEGADGEFALYTGYFDQFDKSYEQETIIGAPLRFIPDAAPVYSASAPSAT